MSRIRTMISTALSPHRSAGEDAVHFHGGPDGVYVCENAKCDSPGLDPSES